MSWIVWKTGVMSVGREARARWRTRTSRRDGAAAADPETPPATPRGRDETDKGGDSPRS